MDDLFFQRAPFKLVSAERRGRCCFSMFSILSVDLINNKRSLLLAWFQPLEW